MELESIKLGFQSILHNLNRLRYNSLIHIHFFSSPNSLNSHFSQLSPTNKLSLSHTLIILQIKKLFFFFNLQVNIQTFFFLFFGQTWLIYILTFSFGRYIYTHITFILLMSNVLFVIVIYYHYYYYSFLYLLFVLCNGLLYGICNGFFFVMCCYV